MHKKLKASKSFKSMIETFSLSFSKQFYFATSIKIDQLGYRVYYLKYRAINLYYYQIQQYEEHY